MGKGNKDKVEQNHTIKLPNTVSVTISVLKAS